MLNSQGTLYVIAAPSGGGKTRLVRALLERDSGINVSISCTTRPPRPNDQEGVDYFFKTEADFQAMVDDNAFLEHAEVFGYRYGTSHEWVIEQLEKGVDIILEIDWQGARQVKQLFPQVVTVFIIPPSLAILQQRLQGRNEDSADVIARRMSKAQSEMAHYYEFDYLLMNDDFEVLVEQAQHIIQSNRLKTAQQDRKLSSLLEELLEKH
ncbi:MAG: guanylate kinase [Legionellales bacterium]|nr:guanylate kinase [Legionellales bacterium]HAG61576.1 guanylate kinase [Coxiellaceae bacterium]